MTRKTILHAAHVQMGARMTEFSGWEMPLHYGSQIAEHNSVRRSVGMFDTSHLTVVDVAGQQAGEFLRKLLANDVAKLTRRGQLLYSCMLNDNGGVIDDLVVCAMDVYSYRLVLNAGTRARDLAWIGQQALAFSVSIRERDDLAMISLQGPASPTLAEKHGLSGASELKSFHAIWRDEHFISRTGYTGEDGFEIILPQSEAVERWERLYQDDVRPCGLGARDTLRLEAGMRLYGLDMDESVTPLECGLVWTVAWKPEGRNFIGREALIAQMAAGPHSRFVGLILKDKGILRSHQRVLVEGTGEGIITSGGFSPTLGKSIALARVPAATGDRCRVEIRGELKRARVVKPCFVRFGEPQFGL
ncbi:MAG: glycine cleavage system aminomethyltransferase GcvT [Pseudomonadota bacterium]